MRTRIVLLTALLLALVTVPAVADDLTVDVVMGARGAVPVDTSFDVGVTASSTRLWEGLVVVEASTLRFGVPLELPAGTSKATTIRVPPLPSGTTVRVFLEATDGTRSPVQRFGQDADEGGTWVAAHGVGASELDTISRARSVPAGVAPHVDEVTEEHLADLSGYHYLVVGGSVPSGSVDHVAAWVERGGRLVGPAATVAAVAAGADTEVAGLPVTLLGDGEVIATGGSPVDWDVVLRDPGVAQASDMTGFGDPYSALLGSAVGVAGSPLGTMPGLLPGLALYVLVAGPINLLILGRLRKRHLAWVTIPVISAVAVGALWFLGPRQHRVDVTAAEIVIGDSDHHTVWSAMAAGDGEYLIDPDADLVAGLGPRRADVVPRPDGTVSLDLSTGEPTGVYSWRTSAPMVAATMDGDRWTVTNTSDTTMRLWGVAEPDQLRYSDTPLGPGESGTPARTLQIGDPWTPRLQQVIWNAEFVDNRGWTVYEPLMGATQSFTTDIETFAWGLAEDQAISVSVDGQTRNVDTVRMMVMPVDTRSRIGQHSVTVVANDGLTRDAGSGVFYGSGSVTLGYRVDPTTASLRVDTQDWGIPLDDDLEIFDFTTGSFTGVADWEVPDTTGLIAGSGDVYLRVNVSEAEVWPSMIRLEARP